MTTTVKNAQIDNSAASSYVPTYSSSVGNAAATFSGGAVTTTLASYKSLGRQLNLALNFSAILLAVTPGYIIATLPTGFLPTNSNQYFAVPIKIGSTWETGMARLDSTGTVYIYRANQVNFPGSTAIQCTFSGTFVLA